MQTIKVAMQIIPITKLMIEEGNVNSISDAGVGALCIETAVKGAAMNVKINASTLEKDEDKQKYFTLADQYVARVKEDVLAMMTSIYTKMQI